MFSALSIKSKLTVTVLSSILMAIFLSGGILIYAHYEEQLSSLISKIEVHARIASSNSSVALVDKNKSVATEILHSLSIEPDI